MTLARHEPPEVDEPIIERRRHALQATDSPRLASIIIRTQAQFIGSTDRLRAFSALLDDTARFFDATYALLHEVQPVEQTPGFSCAEVAASRSAPRLDPSRSAALVQCQQLAVRHAVPVQCTASFETAGTGESHSGALLLPIRRDGEVIGVLTLVAESPKLSVEDAEEIQPICALLAQLLEVWQTTRQRRQDQQSIARLSQVAEQMQNGIIITNAEGRIDWVNHAFLDDVSLASHEVLGQSPADICEALSLDTEEAVILAALLRRAEPFAGEFSLIDRRHHRPTWYEISANPFINSSGIAEGLLIMMVDITERRRMQRMKDDFVSTVSHELRTPLTSIAGALSLLDAGVGGALPSSVAEMVSIAHRNSGRLARLIDDLLDLEKLSAGKLRIELTPCAVMPLLNETIAEHQAFAQSFGVDVRCSSRSDEIRVAIDAQRLQQVLRNLLSNATKFSHRGGVVEVASRADDHEVHIDVIDHGVGIPDSFKPNVFQRFSQADDRSGSRVGTGLGLAISKELVEGMRGTLTFTSTEGVGSTFSIHLPIWTDRP